MDFVQHLLVLAAVLTAIFSERIDDAVNGNGMVRKVVLVSALGSILIVFIPVCMKKML